MAHDLGPPEMFKAAEKLFADQVEAAQAEHGGNHLAAVQSVMQEAGRNPTLAGAIIFLHLAYFLEALNRSEAKLN